MKKTILFYSLLLSAAIFFAGCDDPAPVLPSTNRENNLAMGNPSNAATNDNQNYLIVKSQYVLSYNESIQTANWVAWHLSSDWKGSATRQNVFKPDPDLPASFFHVTTNTYTGTLRYVHSHSDDFRPRPSFASCGGGQSPCGHRPDAGDRWC